MCPFLFNRFDITAEQLSRLAVVASEYFWANALFLPSLVNPIVWTMGYIIPSHTQDVHRKYKQGLGTVTMEGREAKHIVLKKHQSHQSLNMFKCCLVKHGLKLFSSLKLLTDVYQIHILHNESTS